MADKVTPFAPATDADDTKQVTGLTEPKTLPLTGMSRANQLLPFLPFGATTLWNWSKDGRFPAPVKLSPTCTAWRNADVHEWFASHAPVNEAQGA